MGRFIQRSGNGCSQTGVEDGKERENNGHGKQKEVKIEKNSGITIVMALFFLLIASMISVVILSAAQTAMKNSAADKKAQHAYLYKSRDADYYFLKP